jgi:hypothetical protein
MDTVTTPTLLPLLLGVVVALQAIAAAQDDADEAAATAVLSAVENGLSSLQVTNTRTLATGGGGKKYQC